MIFMEGVVDQITMLVWGLVAALIFRLLVEPLIPASLKEAIGYRYKYARKYLALSGINTTLIVTAKSQATTPVPIDKFVDQSKQAVLKKGYRPSFNGESMTFDTPLGQYARSRPHSQSRTMKIKFDMSSDDEDGELIVRGVKIRIYHTCTLRNIGSCLLELQSTLDMIKPIMANLNIKQMKEVCLECKLNKMPNVSIMLDAMQDEKIQVRVSDGRGFELTEDTIRYYTEVMERDLHTFLKRIIVAYA